jgi:hypothetical protein
MIYLKGLILCMLKSHTHQDEAILCIITPVISYSFEGSRIILCEILGPYIRDFSFQIFTYVLGAGVA